MLDNQTKKEKKLETNLLYQLLKETYNITRQTDQILAFCAVIKRNEKIKSFLPFIDEYFEHIVKLYC